MSNGTARVLHYRRTYWSACSFFLKISYFFWTAQTLWPKRIFAITCRRFRVSLRAEKINTCTPSRVVIHWTFDSTRLRLDVCIGSLGIAFGEDGSELIYKPRYAGHTHFSCLDKMVQNSSCQFRLRSPLGTTLVWERILLIYYFKIYEIIYPELIVHW